MRDPLLHHGDVEVVEGLLDLAVNVYSGRRPTWLDSALHAAVDDAAAYPNADVATAAVAAHHHRPGAEVLLTAGAAEAFSLIARLRPWRRPVVVHPQFTEPHAALRQAGHDVTAVVLPRPFRLDPALVPEDADLVMVGNPTNPTGVLHPGEAVRALVRPGRLVVVDEAFMDTVPGQTESLADGAGPGLLGVPGLPGLPGLLVIRSLTKQWSIPGIRAGYLLADTDVVAGLRRGQVPWSVSTPALAAITACTAEGSITESARRASEIASWRERLEKGLADRGVDHLPSATSFVLVRAGVGVHARLRQLGVAVRRADTFPGLDAAWIRVAVKPPEITDQFLQAMEQV